MAIATSCAINCPKDLLSRQLRRFGVLQHGRICGFPAAASYKIKLLQIYFAGDYAIFVIATLQNYIL